MRATPLALLVLSFLLGVTSSAQTQEEPLKITVENKLTQYEREDGWLLLFDGKSSNGWTTDKGEPSKAPVENGTLNPHGSGGYMLVHKRQWGDFSLTLDYKLSKGCNSGVFLRTSPLTPRPGKDVGYNGLEIALDDTAPGTGYHDSGALYDLAKPRINPQRPAGQWNRLGVICRGPKISIYINRELVNEVNLDRFTEPNRRPDGSAHKFDVAYKKHPRRGYIGLQDHGSPCWFANIKVIALTNSSP